MRGALAPTLFPYTTLFRSLCGAMAGAAGASHVGELFACMTGAGIGCAMASVASFGASGSGGGADFAAEPRGSAAKSADRKSTRLNSSQTEITYAVFCLKKN